MTSTPRPRTRFAHRITPEVAAEWDAHLAANKRADVDYRTRGMTYAHDHTTQRCLGCVHLTTHASQLCAACRKDQP